MKSTEGRLTCLLKSSPLILSPLEECPRDKCRIFLCASFLKKCLAPATLGDLAIAFSMLDNVLLLLCLLDDRRWFPKWPSEDCFWGVGDGITACGFGERLENCICRISEAGSFGNGGGFRVKLLDVLEALECKLDPKEFGIPKPDSLLVESAGCWGSLFSLKDRRTEMLSRSSLIDASESLTAPRGFPKVACFDT